MRKILLVVATVMCMGGAFAQLSMGPKLGLNVSSLTGDGSNFRAGMNVGIFANYRINKLLAIQPEFYYSMQGAGFDDISVLTKTLESNYTSHYLNIPVLLKIYPWAGLNVHFVLNSASVSMMNIKRSWREKRFRPKIWNHMDMAIRLKHSIFLLLWELGMSLILV